MITELAALSVYQNFSASQNNVIPAKAYRHEYLEATMLAMLAEDEAIQGKELWLFGPQTDIQSPFQSVCFGVQNPGLVSESVFRRVVTDSWHSIDLLDEMARGKQVAFLIDVGYLASLFDPRPCLVAIKRIMLRQEVCCYFLMRQTDQGQIRQWTAEEFKNFLVAAGWQITSHGANGDYAHIIRATLSTDDYRDYLSRSGFADTSLETNLLVIASDGISSDNTQAIHSYIKHAARLIPDCLILAVAEYARLDSHCLRAIDSRQVVGDLRDEEMFEGEGLIEAVKVLLLTFPNLRVCEFPDSRSPGYRLVQSRKTGGLPGSLKLRAFLHGNLDVLKHRISTRDSAIYSPDDVRSVIKDRFIFANADETVAPSRGILDWLESEFGYSFRVPRVQQLPFDLSELPPLPGIDAFATPDTIVYLDPRSDASSGRHWHDFMQTMAQLGQIAETQALARLIVVSSMPVPEQDKARLDTFIPCVEFAAHDLDIRAFILEHRERSLFIMPGYVAHASYISLELSLCGCRWTTLGGGGIHAPSSVDLTTVRYDPATLIEDIARLITTSDPQVLRTTLTIAANTRRLQQKVNEAFIESAKALPAPSEGDPAVTFDATSLDEITVVTPVYNTPLTFLQDLAQSIRTSSVRPRQWILINDGSPADYSTALKTFVATLNDMDVHLIEQPNKGLAGARNRGLAEVTTRYAYFMDSDDLFMTHTLAHAAVALNIQSEPVLAVSGNALAFNSLEQLPDAVASYRCGYYWKPLGISGARTLGIHHHEFICASSMVSVGLARELGGWDESDRATWEDWAFYLKSAWQGASVLLMPGAGYLYRNTPGSMSKTYNEYFGVRRLVRSLPFADRFDANALLGMIQFKATQPPEIVVREVEVIKEVEVVREVETPETEQLRQELARTYRSLSWRITRPVRGIRRLASAVRSRMVARHPGDPR